MANMDYITRAQMQHKNQQALTSFDWEFDIDFGSYIGYHPPIDFIRRAVTSISGDCDNPLPIHSPIQIQLRGFVIQQPGMTDPGGAPGIVSMEAQDFEDLSLFAWWYDWINRCNSVQNRASYRKESVFVDLDIWRLNSTRVRVLQMHYFNCLPTQPGYSNAFSEQKQAVGQMAMAFQPEWRLVTPLNI